MGRFATYKSPSLVISPTYLGANVSKNTCCSRMSELSISNKLATVHHYMHTSMIIFYTTRSNYNIGNELKFCTNVK